MVRGQKEVRAQLERQMGRLGRAINQYRMDHIDEAYNIATVICNLVLDRGRQATSIITQLGAKEKIQFLLGDPLSLLNLASECSLTMLGERDHKIVWWPRFMDPNTFEHDQQYGGNFEVWWSIPVYKEPGKASPYGSARTLSRQDLILVMRDKDGGSHFQVDAPQGLYAEFAAGTSSGYRLVTSASPEGTVIEGQLEAAVTQIGWELMTTLLSAFPEIPTSVGTLKGL